MELFKNIRLKIGDAILRNKIAHTKRKIHYSNISEVKNIGIVWDASKIEDFTCLSKFYQKMHENKTDVKIMGYFPGNNLPNQLTAVRFLSIIKKEELNIFYHPVSSDSNSFVGRRFDVLIDLNFKKLLPLQYISSLSNAGFKVGLFDSDNGNTPFDLMMDLKSPVNVEDYLNQVIHYLEMINSGTANKVIQ
ncbi:MAG: hypothetical protein WA816_15020 [Bacteroidales bacterium]